MNRIELNPYYSRLHIAAKTETVLWMGSWNSFRILSLCRDLKLYIPLNRFSCAREITNPYDIVWFQLLSIWIKLRINSSVILIN